MLTFSSYILTVHATDVIELNVLGALSGAGTGIGTVTETELIHLVDHSADTAILLDLTLRQESQLTDLG